MGSVHYSRPACYTGEMGGSFYLRLVASVGGCWAIQPFVTMVTGGGHHLDLD